MSQMNTGTNPVIAQTNANHALSLCRALVAGGVRHVIVSPGSRSTPLVLAFHALEQSGRYAGLRLHVVLDERAAAFMAVGLGRVTGFPAVLVCTSGSACAHYLPACIEAYHSHIPLIAISADRPAEAQDCGSGQTIRQPGIFGQFVRESIPLAEPTRDVDRRWLRTAAARALIIARGTPSGPVHINAPFREPLWEQGTRYDVPADEEYPARIRVGRRASDASVSQDDLEFWTDRALAELADSENAENARRVLTTGLRDRSSPQIRWLAGRLASSPHGLIVAGSIDHVSRIGADGQFTNTGGSRIEALAKALQWPLIAEFGSGLRYMPSDTEAEGSAPIITSYNLMLAAPGFGSAFAPGVVLRFGHAPTTRALGEWLGRVGRERTILVDASGEWHDPTHTADLLMVADPEELAGGLAREVRRIGPEVDPHWTAAWREAERLGRRAIADHTLDPESDTRPWEAAVAAAVLEAVNETVALHVASSMPIREFDTIGVPKTRGQRVYFNRGANGIDGTISTAFGEAIGDPERPVVLLAGELALLHDTGGLIAAGQSRARLTVVCIDNGGGGIFGFLPIAAHPAFERLFLTPQNVAIEPLVQSVGGRFALASSLAGLRRLLNAAIPREGLDVIVVPVDRATNLKRHQQLREDLTARLTLLPTPADRIARTDSQRLESLNKERLT
ncbi:MAG: 2-succinyl-5-enolpyruvyl-6-hydroxy-3-cyclohexene-1-carboxylic-acid synthase [Planctomycetota bacterium]